MLRLKKAPVRDVNPAGFDDYITLDARRYKHPEKLHGRIGELMREYGIVRLAHAFPVKELEPLIRRANRLVEDIDCFRRNEITEEALYEKYYRFNIWSYALRILKMEQKDIPSIRELRDTETFRILAASPVLAALKYLSSYRLAYGAAEIRVTYPLAPAMHQGGLRWHFENSDHPCAHVMWMPLVKPPLLCNRDTPGIAFMLRKRERDEPLLDTMAKAQALVDHFGEWPTDRLTEESLPEMHGDFFRFTPRIGAGDVLLFDSVVTHFSYFPREARLPRVSLDMRVFPETLQTVQEALAKPKEMISLNA